MDVSVFLLMGVSFIIINCFLTYFISKRSQHKILRYIPVLISLVGALYFGISPQFINYGISIGITFMVLGVFCGVAFVTSSITLIGSNIVDKNKRKLS
ncbi:hypothetical protein SH2C18_50460 [Clostridium sediminicola]|uniref:hypothetical protein n=1 Tax=Clostridium sediminicola TaxID=3114879 RepID=UPI0031F25CF0